MSEQKVTNEITVVEKDWKYHAKSAFITFLMFFLPVLVIELRQGNFELDTVSLGAILGVLGAIFRAIIKAVIEAIVPTIIACADKIYKLLKK